MSSNEKDSGTNEKDTGKVKDGYSIVKERIAARTSSPGAKAVSGADDVVATKQAAESSRREASSDVVATKQSTGDRAVVPGAVATTKGRRSKRIDGSASTSSDVVATKQSTGGPAVVPGAVATTQGRRSKRESGRAVSTDSATNLEPPKMNTVEEDYEIEPEDEDMGSTAVAAYSVSHLTSTKTIDEEAPKFTDAAVATPIVYDANGNIIDADKLEEYDKNNPIQVDDPMEMQILLENEDIIISDYKDDHEIGGIITKKAFIFGGIFVIVATVIGVVLALVVFAPGENYKTEQPSVSPSFAPTATLFQTITSIIKENGVTPDEGFTNTINAQYRAVEFLAETDTYVSDNQLMENHSKLIQRYILTVFYFSTGGDDWERCSRFDAGCHGGESSYLSDTSECDWKGIVCDSNNTVIKLEYMTVIKGTNEKVPNLTGTLPEELGYLSDLKEISIYNDAISGTIPTTLGLLEKLEKFYLEGLPITGEIPIEFQNLKHLEELTVTFCILDKRLKNKMIEGLTSLKELNLFRNKIPGKIPSELGIVPSLTDLNLAGNFLTGTIPTAMYNLTKLESMRFDNTLLSGTLSTAIANLKNLEILLLHQNSMSGTVPTELGLLDNLESLTFSNFSGDVPVQICNLGLDDLVVDCEGLECNCCTESCLET